MVVSISTKTKWYASGFLLMFFCIPGLASVVMNKAKDTPFPFPVSAQACHPSSAQGYKAGIATWFVGVGEPLAGDDGAYSISYVPGGSSLLSPLVTSTTILVNNVPGQPHPLRGRPVRFLNLLGLNPLIVPADNLSELILLNISTDPHRVLRIILFDRHDRLAAAVDVAVLQNPNHIPDVVVINPNMTIAVAIRPPTGMFGDQGSGISMIMTAVVKDSHEDPQKKNDNFKPEDLAMAVLGIIPLDRMSQLIAVGHPAAAMKDFVTLHACEALSRVFVGVNVTSDIHDEDGAMAVLVAEVKRIPGSPVDAVMEPVVSPTVMGADSIVAARISKSQGVSVAAHRLGTMRTSTGLDYLMVNGGVGNDADTSRRVFALPLVRASGKLAHVYAPPVTSYYGNLPIDRAFVTLPETAADLYSSSSIPAQVGGGPLHASSVDMIVSGDAVFAVTRDVGNGHAPGIWHSQAIFGKQGTIIAWTPWRRTGGAHSAVSLKSCLYDEHAGTWWITTVDGQARMTTWSMASPLSTLIKEVFGDKEYARYSHEVVRALFPGLLIMTGHTNVAFVQTDQIRNGLVFPRTDFSQGYTSTDGTSRDIKSSSEYSWLAFRGGALSSIGPLTSSVVIDDGKNRLIMVAGNKGVALFARSDLSGYGSDENFGGITPDIAWQVLPLRIQGEPVAHIRKLIYDSGFLYILTTTSLLRVDVDQVLYKQNYDAVTVLATMNGLGGMRQSTFVDVFIAGPLACLATSVGCFRSGNNINIATVADNRDVQWVRINLPHSPGPVVSLTPVGPVAHRDDAGYDANVYVLSAAATSMQARIYRITISHAGTVTDDTLSLFPDEIVKDKTGFFLSIGDYRNHIATDGALLCAMRNRCGKQPAYAELYSGWCGWPCGLAKSITMVRSAHRDICAEQTAEVSAMTPSNGLGSWLVLTDMGLISNE